MARNSSEGEGSRPQVQASSHPKGSPQSQPPLPLRDRLGGRGGTEARGWGGESERSLMGPWPATRKPPGGFGTTVGRGPLSVLGKGTARRPIGLPLPERTWEEGRARHAQEEESRAGWRPPLRGFLGGGSPGPGDSPPSGSGGGPLAGQAAVRRLAGPGCGGRPHGTLSLGISRRDFKNSLADV